MGDKHKKKSILHFTWHYTNRYHQIPKLTRFAPTFLRGKLCAVYVNIQKKFNVSKFFYQFTVENNWIDETIESAKYFLL